MERIIVAGAWSSEGEAAGREEKVGKKGGCGLMPGYQAMEEKSKIWISGPALNDLGQIM